MLNPSATDSNALLAEAIGPFAAAHPLASLAARPVAAGGLPGAFATLLDHPEHMTTRLEQFHRSELELRVLDCDHSPAVHRYSRRILLVTPQHGIPVELGIAHIDLDALPGRVTAEILAQDAPLGDILIRHDVLRKVEPLAFFAFSEPSSVRAPLGAPPAEPLYGRVARILCSGRPAIRLLEVVHARPASRA